MRVILLRRHDILCSFKLASTFLLLQIALGLLFNPVRRKTRVSGFFGLPIKKPGFNPGFSIFNVRYHMLLRFCFKLALKRGYFTSNTFQAESILIFSDKIVFYPK